MALDPSTGSSSGKKGRKKWAYMRVGYKRGKATGWTSRGAGTKKTPVFKWVQVGSSFFRQLTRKGVTPRKFKTGASRPTSSPSANPRGPGRREVGTAGGHRPGPPGKKEVQRNKAARAKAGHGGGGGGGGGGGQGRRRNKGGGGGGGASTYAAVGAQFKIPKASRIKKPGQMADRLAGMQFDPAIRELRTALSRMAPQQAQNMRDLEDWYGEAERLNTLAGSRNAATTGGLAAAQEAATQRVIESLGGGANAAGGALGAAGLAQSGLIRALGAADQQSHGDLTGLLQQEQAGAMRAEQARNKLLLQDQQLALSDLLGQRGAAKQAAFMDILGFNREGSQQRFANELSGIQAQAGVAGLGLDLEMKRAQIRATKAQTRAQRAETKAATGGGGFQPWAKLNPRDQYDLMQMAVYRQGGAKRTKLQAQEYLRGIGYSPVGNFGIKKALGSYY